MSETGEMPPGMEVVKNPVVEGARKAVRGGLETNEAWRKYRDTLNVKTEGKSVYRGWVDAADKVVGAMTKADQEKLSTKLYALRMRLDAGALQISSALVDTTFNVVSWLPRKVMMFGGVLNPMFTAGLAFERAASVGPTRYWTLHGAEQHAQHRIWRYKMAETKETIKHGGAFVGERVKQIVEGFAYPEGKPVKPPMVKV